MDLQQLEDAQTCLDELLGRFPSHLNNKNVLMLQKDINTAVEASRQRERSLDDVYSENELVCFTNLAIFQLFYRFFEFLELETKFNRL